MSLKPLHNTRNSYLNNKDSIKVWSHRRTVKSVKSVPYPIPRPPQKNQRHRVENKAETDRKSAAKLWSKKCRGLWRCGERCVGSDVSAGPEPVCERC